MAGKKNRVVEYQVDTIPQRVEPYGGANYFSQTNAITIIHQQNNESFNEWSHSGYALHHEVKHMDNQHNGIYAYALSKEQAYKVNMHDEISANITSLIYLRNEYIKTGDINVFNIDSRFKFYTDAIKRGEINPRSQYQEDFDKEMRLIANGTRDMWMQGEANYYIEQNYASALGYYDIGGKGAKFYDANYERALKVAYGNIGGVDFTKYMDKDVEIPSKAHEMLKNGRVKPESVYQRMVASECDRRGWPVEYRDSMLEYIQKHSTVNIMLTGKGREEVLENTLEKRYKQCGNASKNAPINPIKDNDPQYKKWKDKDGFRVSDVQKIEILDMNSNVIQKPTKSRATHGRMRQDSQNATTVINSQQHNTHNVPHRTLSRKELMEIYGRIKQRQN